MDDETPQPRPETNGLTKKVISITSYVPDPDAIDKHLGPPTPELKSSKEAAKVWAPSPPRRPG